MYTPGNYEEFLDGLARYRNIPGAATHKSPAELFFSRQLREPDLAQLPPTLDLSKNHEAVLAKKLQKGIKCDSAIGQIVIKFTIKTNCAECTI